MATQPPRVPRNDFDRPTVDSIARPADARPVDTSFKTFGLLPETKQGKGSTFVSLVVNGLLVLIALILSTQAAKVLAPKNKVDISKLVPVKKEDLPKPKPKVELPKPPKLEVVPPEPPKIELPKVEMVEPPKMQTPVMQSKPIPVIQPAAPKIVNPPPAPKVVAIKPQAAAIANNNPNPSPVRLGSMTNPINNTSGPAVSKLNLGNSGAPGMPASNSGMGPATKVNLGGSGSPSGRIGGSDNAARPIAGVKLGVTGGTGALTNRPTSIVGVQRAPEPIRTNTPTPTGTAKTPPKVLFKPKPEYTAEARQLHLEGSIGVRIHVTATGSVQVLGVQGSGLGHGLNEAAIRAVQGMRFQPAVQDGHAVDWDGTVNITFQLA